MASTVLFNPMNMCMKAVRRLGTEHRGAIHSNAAVDAYVYMFSYNNELSDAILYSVPR